MTIEPGNPHSRRTPFAELARSYTPEQAVRRLRCFRRVRLLLLTAATTLLIAAPAVACPPREACMVALRSTVRAPERDKPLIEAEQVPLVAPARPKSAEVEMPWIWKTLRERVYSRMPSYEQSRDFKLTLAPVVVASPSDTVPGIGIAGDF